MTGRPRDADLEKRLLRAAWQLLIRDGYDGVTLPKVAAAAGTPRSSVYRRWSSKAQLVVAVLGEHLPRVPQADTGSLRTDLRAYVDALAGAWAAPWMDGVVGLLGDLRHDPDAELSFLRLGERRGQVARDALLRALERGEIASLPEPGFLGDLLEGPLMHRRLIDRQPFTVAFLDRLANVAHQLAVTADARP